MANTLSAKKRVRSSLRKRHYNRATRSAVKTLVLRARRIGGTPSATMTNPEVRQAERALDKAAEKGVLHPNNAARRKSRLMRALVKAGVGAGASAAAAQPGGKAAPRTKGKRKN